MRSAENRLSFAAPLLLTGMLLVQVVTHLAWLSISTQVGQLTIPYLMSRGLPIFSRVIENRPPADAALLALLFRLLPSIEPIFIVRALNLLLVLGLTLLIYGLAKRLTASTLAGIGAALFWTLWEPVYGNILFYFDALVGAVFALTVLVWLMAEARRPGWLAPLLCGLLLGGATLLKQQAWAGVILFALWLIFGARRGRQLPAFVVGVLVFPLAAILMVAVQGTLDNYLFWNYSRYFSGIPNAQPLTGNIVRKFLLTNILAFAFLLQIPRRDQPRQHALVGTLWLAGGAMLLPNFSEIYVMGHLPLLSVMSGCVIASIVDFEAVRAPIRWLRGASTTSITLTGLALALALGWGWTIAVTYVPNPLGRASIPAYDEFRPVAARLTALRQPDDTLFVLPMSDGNSQLYALTGMLPPGTFVNSHAIFLNVSSVDEMLLAEWAIHPPDLMVYFPQLQSEFEPGVLPLIGFMQAHYHAVDQIDDVLFNGDAIIYRLNEAQQ